MTQFYLLITPYLPLARQRSLDVATTDCGHRRVIASRQTTGLTERLSIKTQCLDPLESKGSYSARSNNMKLVHWSLMGGLSHLVQRGGDWAGAQPAQAPLCCTKRNSPPINGQCTNHCIMVRCSVVLMWVLKD